MDRRQRNKLRTREALVDAAVRLFSERGFDGTTIEDLADAADVSPRTFFRYFASKEDVLVADMPGYATLVERALAPTEVDEPVHVAIRRAVLALAEVFTAPDRLALTQLALSIPPVMGRVLESQARIEQAFVEGLAARLRVDPVKDPLPRAAAGAALGCVRAAVHVWVSSGGRADPVSVAAQTLDLLDVGLVSLRPGTPSRGNAQAARSPLG